MGDVSPSPHGALARRGGKGAQPEKRRGGQLVICMTSSIFLLSLVVRRALQPLTSMLPALVGSLIVIAVHVSLVTWLIMPRLTRRLARWLFA